MFGLGDLWDFAKDAVGVIGGVTKVLGGGSKRGGGGMVGIPNTGVNGRPSIGVDPFGTPRLMNGSWNGAVQPVGGFWSELGDLVETVSDWGIDIPGFEIVDALGINRGAATTPAPAVNGSAGGCAAPAGVLAPQVTQRLKAPRGYVIVECPENSGRKVAMLKELARKYGYWKPRKKPPISVKDWRCLMRAEATVNRVDRVVKATNAVTGKRKWSKARPAAKSTRTRRR